MRSFLETSKRAVLQQLLPADLRQALQSKTNIDSYADFRAALRDDVLARKAWRSGPVPMEIGAVQERKGGKGKHDKKGKGKGGKHDKKGKHDKGGAGLGQRLGNVTNAARSDIFVGTVLH